MKFTEIIPLGFLCVILGLLPLQTWAETNPATGNPVDYIPQNVPDAVRVLKKNLTKDELAQVQDPKNTSNFFLGMGLRNSWGLWKGSRLSQWFNSQGVYDPEEMSGIILDALVADLKAQPFDLQKALAKARADGLQQVKEEKDNQQLDMASVAKIKTMMLGLRIVGKPSQTVTLPPRSYSGGIRIRYIAPFAGGFLVMGKRTEEFICHSPVYFLDLTKKTIHKLQVNGMTRVENGLVLDGQAYLEGPGARGDILVCSDGKLVRQMELPPGSGQLRLGQDGDQLLALRTHAVYRLQGDHWTTLVETKEEIPVALVPPERIGNRIYLRDEGRDEDDKRLWWIDLADNGHLTCFDQDCGVVGAEGPRWENVWSYAVGLDGQLWLSPGYSLVRWDKREGYRVALMNGEPVFDGQLLKGINPTTSSAGANVTVLGSDSEKLAPLAATGITILGDGKTLDVIGPNGLFRLSGNEITPLLAFKNMAQEVPTGEPNPYSKDESYYHWSVDPTHLVLLANDSYLIGNQWEGLYLLAKDAQGIYQFISLDEKIGSDVTIDRLTGQ